MPGPQRIPLALAQEAPEVVSLLLLLRLRLPAGVPLCAHGLPCPMARTHLVRMAQAGDPMRILRLQACCPQPPGQRVPAFGQTPLAGAPQAQRLH